MAKMSAKEKYWRFPSNRHQFFMIMFGDFQNRLRIPRKYVRNFKGDFSETVQLRGPSREVWTVKLVRTVEGVYFQDGWKMFVEDHSLEEADFLVFRYDGNSSFNVVIFDKTGCEREASYFVQKQVSTISPKKEDVVELDEIQKMKSIGSGARNEIHQSEEKKKKKKLGTDQKKDLDDKEDEEKKGNLKRKSGNRCSIGSASVHRNEVHQSAGKEVHKKQKKLGKAPEKDLRVPSPMEKPREDIYRKGKAKHPKQEGISGTSVNIPRPSPRKEDMGPEEHEYSSCKLFLKHINNKYQVLLPSQFVKEARLKSKQGTVIKDPEGRKFTVSISVVGVAEQIYLSTGWNDLWKANDLQVGSTIMLKLSHGGGTTIELEILSNGAPVKRKAY